MTQDTETKPRKPIFTGLPAIGPEKGWYASHGDGEIVFLCQILPDDDATPPWKMEDGHGPVSEVKAKTEALPGEALLASYGYRGRFYDMEKAVEQALREQWGSLWPYTLTVSPRSEEGVWVATAEAPKDKGLPRLVSSPCQTPQEAIRAIYAQRRGQCGDFREYAINAVRADYERLKAWCDGEWYYVGVSVKAFYRGWTLGTRSAWGLESDNLVYLLEVANELAEEILADNPSEGEY